MYFIQYARGKKEQNLIAAQYNENLYFKAERDILPGEELLVWYDQQQYNLYMGIPRGFVYLNPEDKLGECSSIIYTFVYNITTIITLYQDAWFDNIKYMKLHICMDRLSVSD